MGNEYRTTNGSRDAMVKINLGDARSQFLAAMAGHDLKLSALKSLISDGQYHRCDVGSKGKSGLNDGSYLLHLHPYPVGFFRNWIDPLGGLHKWRYQAGRNEPELTAAEEKEIRRAAARAKDEYEKMR